jgi:hypothetical protein
MPSGIVFGGRGSLSNEKNDFEQGCQIFLDTIYKNEGKYTKLPQHYQMTIKYTK